MIKEMMINFFHTYASIIVFLHILSAIIWVGGMIAIRFAVHYAIQDIDEPKIKLARTLDFLKRFFNIVIPFILILAGTAGIMAIGLGFKGTPLYPIVHLKDFIWLVMAIIFIIIYKKREKAELFFNENNFKEAKQTLQPIAKYLIPLNIVLGIFALYLGVTLRGF
jgi:uncharacterized membrane protein